mgnify:CR=1 FL=1
MWKESEIVNKQKKFKNGVLVGRGIEWTDYTWNPIGGCFHACQWQMPDGSIANCYAEDVADRVAQKAYLNGFEHHYWNPNELNAPMGLRLPSRIFVGSMADVFGHWVPDEQIKAVLDVALVNPEHTFQFLTKNPRRVLDFAKDIPANCWIGASTSSSALRAKALPAAATAPRRWVPWISSSWSHRRIRWPRWIVRCARKT